MLTLAGIAQRIEGAYPEQPRGRLASWLAGTRRRLRPTFRAGGDPLPAGVEVAPDPQAEPPLPDLFSPSAVGAEWHGGVPMGRTVAHNAFVDAGEEQRFKEASIATALGDAVLPDPQEEWLGRFHDATLLDMAVVAHAHGASASQVHHMTGQLRPAVHWSLQRLEHAGLVRREQRPGSDHWFATPAGARLGVVPYVARLLAAARPFYRGDAYGGWSVGRFRKIGTEKGPPAFRPSLVIAGVNDADGLAKVIRTGIPEDRAFALTKLIALNDPASVPVLGEVAERRGDEEPLARQAAVALGHFDTEASRATLIGLAGHRDSFIREAAARSLGWLHAAEAVPVLEGLMTYPSEPVRVAALGALRRIGDRQAVPAIVAALNDDHGDVRRAARHALIHLGAAESLMRNPGRAWPLRVLDAREARGVIATRQRKGEGP